MKQFKQQKKVFYVVMMTQMQHKTGLVDVKDL